MDVARSAPQELTTMRTLSICSLVLGRNREQGAYVTPIKVYTNSFYPSGQHTLLLLTKCMTLFDRACQ